LEGTCESPEEGRADKTEKLLGERNVEEIGKSDGEEERESYGNQI